jgi:hypothetical protein
MNNKSDYKLIIIIGLLLAISLAIGTSYAYWMITHTQTNKNVASTGCFTTTFTEANDINLTNQFPISDDDVEELIPYNFTITNTCSIATNYQINMEVLNTTNADLSYIKTELNNDTPVILNTYSIVDKTIDTATSSYKMTTGYLGVGGSVTYNLRIWIDQDAPLATMQNKLFESKIVVINSATSTKYLAQTLIDNAGGIEAIESKSTPNYSLSASSNEGMYEAADDYGKSYYYRSNQKNNIVKFANNYWQIVRINGNGTIRLIYYSSLDHSLSSIAESAFNTNSNDNAYVGYMYGTIGSSTYDATHTNTNSSTIKTIIDTWYNTNLSSYADKLSDTEFCNDRSIASVAATWETDDTALGYGNNKTYYGYIYRQEKTSTPILTCPNKHDRFTVDDTIIGNGDLTYPIGLLTMDEMIISGGSITSFNINGVGYLSGYYWTMTPFMYDSTSAREEYVYSSSSIHGGLVNASSPVRPVINLNSNITYSQGDGSFNNPYVIS